MASLTRRAVKIYYDFENTILKIFNFPFPSDKLVPALTNLPILKQDAPQTKSLNDILKDAILWAVPKKRKTIEKRRTARFGHSKYGYKIFLPKTNILRCTKCGSYHEAGVLCPSCYEKIRNETKLMQKAIQAELGVSPVEDEVVVLYSGERNPDPEFYKGKRVVEMEKERPKLFSNNLLQRSTQPPADTKDVVEKSEIS